MYLAPGGHKKKITLVNISRTSRDDGWRYTISIYTRATIFGIFLRKKMRKLGKYVSAYFSDIEMCL